MVLIVVIGEKAELAGDFVDDLLLALAGIGVQIGVVGAVVGVTGSGLGLRLAGRLKLFYRLDLVDGESAAVGLDRADGGEVGSLDLQRRLLDIDTLEGNPQTG